MADYSSRDTANINNFLQTLSSELSIYTYNLLNAGIEKTEYLRNISEDQLLHECSIENSIHRHRILEGIRMLESRMANDFSEDNLNKSLDVFVSYRRSNGSQLASLLKVHLQLRGFSVFIDVERLEAGKFDNNLLQSIQKARHFLLVLTPNALDRCLGDSEQKDWVHRVSDFIHIYLFSSKLFRRKISFFKNCSKQTFFKNQKIKYTMSIKREDSKDRIRACQINGKEKFYQA